MKKAAITFAMMIMFVGTVMVSSASESQSYEKVWDSGVIISNPAFDVAVGDTDGDGNPDIIVSDHPTSDGAKIYVFENAGDDSYQLVWNSGTTFTMPLCYMEIGDQDSDGKLEIIAVESSGTRPYNGKIHVFENNGDNTYQEVWNSGVDLSGIEPSGLFLGEDADNDGKREIIIGTDYQCGDRKIRVYENTGDNTYQEVWNSGSALWDTVLEGAVGDTDGDGKKEIVVGSGDLDSQVHVFECNGDNSYELVSSLGTFNREIRAIIGDQDGDGKSEIIAGGENGVVHVFEHTGVTGVNTYTSVWNSGTMDGFIDVIATGDQDNDGNGEMIVPCGDGKAYLFENTGDNTYQEVWNSGSVMSGHIYRVATGDQDGDGKLEIIATSRADKKVYVFEGSSAQEASISSFSPQSGTLNPGSPTSSLVTVKNTGTSTRPYWVGLSYQKSDGTWYDVPPQKTNTLTPNSEQILTFDLTLDSDAPPGTYNASTAIWDDYDSNANLMLAPKYEQKNIEDAFNVQYLPIIDSFDTDLSKWINWSNNPYKDRFLDKTNAAVSDDQAAPDNKVLELVFPGKETCEDAASIAGPENGTNIESNQFVSYGWYKARIKAASSKKDEGVVTGFFTFWKKGNEFTDRSEIDFEIFGADPYTVLMTIWTFQQENVGFSKTTRTVNLTTGEIRQTPPGKENTYDLEDRETDQSKIIEGYDATSNYYEYGFDWKPDSVTFFIINTEGETIDLWKFQDQSHIPQHPAKLMFNVWHTNDWTPEDIPDAKNPPSEDAKLRIDWVQYNANALPIDAVSIDSFNPPSGYLNPGSPASSLVTVKNTGTSTRPYWVGLSYQKPDGTWYDVPPQKTDTLNPNGEQILTFNWNLPLDAPYGSYNASTAIWNGYNPSTKLMIKPKYGDSKNIEGAFKVSKPPAPEGVKSLEEYEDRIGEEGLLLENSNIQMWVPKRYEEHSRVIFQYLKVGYANLTSIFGGHDMPVKFSIEHYPLGSSYFEGGTYAEGTIRYSYINLEDNFPEWNDHQVPHMVGYYEEMAHCFANDLGLKGEVSVGFYETLGLMIGGETALRAACNEYTEKEINGELRTNRNYQKFSETTEYYLNHDTGEDGMKENIYLTQILAHIFKTEIVDIYGWIALSNAFSAIQSETYPLRNYHQNHTWGGFLNYLGQVTGSDFHPIFRAYGLPIVQWSGEQGYELDGVEVVDNHFIFRVRLFDRESNQPTNVTLHLYGDTSKQDSYSMSFVEGNSETGWVYEKTLEIQEPEGYEYAFSADDLNHTIFQAIGEPTVKRSIIDDIESTEMTISAFCPVDLLVIDPQGLTINEQLNEIPKASYKISDINGDGDSDDIVLIPDRKTGDYQITVIPETDAEPTDTYTLKVSAGDTTIVLAEDVTISEIPDQPYLIESTKTAIIQIIPATIRIEPETLNLKSNGEWITTYVELPEGHDVSNINVPTINLTNSSGDIITSVDLSAPATIGDYNGNGTSDLMVKFNRTVVVDYFGKIDIIDDGTGIDEEIELVIAGELTDGTIFEGIGQIRLIKRGK
ncbi:MAG: FG-GAP-like repeat-containing protein [Methanosarcinales archaeon]|nr:FG-GAP-like repeat-containing protein [Methanosarcinales archaeon]